MPRLPEPWERAGRGWYVTVNQKQIKLAAEDQAGAEAEVEKLFNPQINKPVVKDGTIDDLIERFLAHGLAKGLHERTVRSNRYELRWLVALLGTNAVVGMLDADKIGAAARSQGWSDSHRHNVLATVQRFARWCGLSDFTIERPAKESRGAESVIRPEDWERIQVETRGDFHQLLRILWLTGARPAEVAMLTVEAVNWDQRCAILKHHKTKKKGKQRILMFGAEAFRILEHQRSVHKSGCLFPNKNGQPYNAQTLAVKLNRVCKRLGIKVTSYHFRHTWATRMLTAGKSDAQVAAAMGHTSTKMIHQNYSHIANNAALIRQLMEESESLT